MFQNVWFNKKIYTKTNCVNPKSCQSDFITSDKIKYVCPLFYDEHCLECSAPACYKSCKHYKSRKDTACVRLDYGIKHLPHNNLLWNVKLKFRDWGKLESRINKGSISVKEIHSLDRKDRLISIIFKIFCSIFQSKTYSFSQKLDGLRRKKYASLNSKTPFATDFLFQYHYNGTNNFNLIFEITDKTNSTIYKNVFNVTNGFGQELLKLPFSLPEGGLVRLFPENNLTEELQIFAADFIELKDSIPQTPNKKIKCVAWDLDNTIWNGILIESDPKTLKLKENVLDTIKNFDQRGIIQIIVSKNDLENVLPVLEQLGIKDYFVYVFANWNPKSSNIYFAAKNLNINIDTFALIDDSDFERGEVSSALPYVRTYKETDLESLLTLPEFNLPITEKSTNRRLSYIQEAKRRKIQTEFSGDNSEFIKKCNLQIVLTEIKNQLQFDRSLELITRTNQLNLSAHRYTKTEFEELLKDGSSQNLILYAKDKFGDYGQVAFIHLTENKDNIIITEFAMSCRVAAKYVENALFAFLLSKYKKDIILSGVKTERNVVLISSFLKAGFTDNCDEKNIRLTHSANESIRHSDIVTILYK